jgi:hypothetical protein
MSPPVGTSSKDSESRADASKLAPSSRSAGSLIDVAAVAVSSYDSVVATVVCVASQSGSGWASAAAASLLLSRRARLLGVPDTMMDPSGSNLASDLWVDPGRRRELKDMPIALAGE